MKLNRAIHNPSLDTLLTIKSRFKCSIDELTSSEEQLSKYNDTFISEEELGDAYKLQTVRRVRSHRDKRNYQT